MPARLLREGILDSDAVNNLTVHEEVFYRRLMSAVDDFGRFDARPAVLRSRLYPLKPTIRDTDISQWLAACESNGLIAVYEVSGKQYILFHKLGSPRAKTSKYPDPPPELEHRLERQRASESICARVLSDAPRASAYSGSGSRTGARESAGARANVAQSHSLSAPESIPPPLKTKEFCARWDEWKAERTARKKPYSAKAEAEQLRVLAEHGLEAALWAISHSLANNWLSLFPEKFRSLNGQPRKPAHGERSAMHFAKAKADDIAKPIGGKS